MAREYFGDHCGPALDDWSAQHAWDRGSFAAFLGISLTDATLQAHAVGDTVLFVVAAGDLIWRWPQITANDFSASPSLLCSLPGRSAFDDTDEAFAHATNRFDAPSGGWAGVRLLAMTDALAEWVLKAEDVAGYVSRLNCISDHRNYAAFENWVASAIEAGDVRRDDCSLMVVDL